MRFLHTADWQLGKPFAGIDDPAKRSLLQQERVSCLSRIGEQARSHGASFIVVSGDLFDSPHATKATVSAACAAIGAMGLEVYAIPGNHDYGGPGGLWGQSFFQREAATLAPNLKVLLKPEPVELAEAVLFPCPLLRRSEAEDTTQWLRTGDWDGLGNKPRIVLAHGSTQAFGNEPDDESIGETASNQIDISRLPAAAYDYIALGDWHGTKQITAHAWYSGTPELDSFPKGGEHNPGNVLLVTVSRGTPVEVVPLRTARIGWHTLAFNFADDTGVEQLEGQLSTVLAHRAGQDLLRLNLSGTLGLAAISRLERLIESLQARLMRIKLTNGTLVAPSQDEIVAMTQRASSPLISLVAAHLVARATGESEDAATARVALRELHAAILD